MTGENDSKSHEPSTPLKNGSSSPLSDPLISSIVHELNITRKSVLLYPLTHHQVKHSSQRAHSQLDALFKKKAQINIGVASDTLIFENNPLDPKNPACQEIAKFLAALDVGVLTINKGVTAEELANFLAVLAQPNHQLTQKDGIETILKQNAVSHIQLTFIDYQKFNVTDESEIILERTDDKTSSSKIWQKVAAHLLKNPDEKETQTITPSLVAHLLNEQPEMAKTVLEQYEQLVDNHLKKDKLSSSPLPDSKSILDIITLLNNLNPKLKSQFLKSTLNQCDQSSEAPQTIAFITQFPHNIIADMIHQVNQKGSGISESLMHLIQKIHPTISNDDSNLGTTVQLEPSKQKLQKLFDEEEYEKYVAQEYDQTLHRLAQMSTTSTTDNNNKDLNILKENLFDPVVFDQHMLEALAGLVNHDNSLEEFKDYSQKIVEIAQKGLSEKDFTLIFKALEILNQQSTAAFSKEISDAAQAAVAQIIGGDFIDDIIKILDKYHSKIPPAIEPLLKNIGPKIIPALVQRYMQGGGSGEKQKIIINVLKNYKKESVAAANQLVQYNEIEKLKKLIFMIRQVDDRASSAYLRSLVAHTDPAVRREALAGLLYFNDPYGTFFLKDQIQSANPADVAQAIAMTGNFKVKEMLSDLTTRLKYAALNKTDIKRNGDIIIAMGKIGDPAAIPFLIKIIQNSWSLYRANLRDLKTLVFKTLKGYPRHEIQTLLELGYRMKDKTIEKILKESFPANDSETP